VRNADLAEKTADGADFFIRSSAKISFISVVSVPKNAVLNGCR